MNLDSMATLVRSSILVVLMSAGPILAVGMGVGLIVSILQAATSIQEQTLTFVPKIIAILFTLFVLSSWLAGNMIEFTRTIFFQIPNAV